MWALALVSFLSALGPEEVLLLPTQFRVKGLGLLLRNLN